MIGPAFVLHCLLLILIGVCLGLILGALLIQDDVDIYGSKLAGIVGFVLLTITDYALLILYFKGKI